MNFMHFFAKSYANEKIDVYMCYIWSQLGQIILRNATDWHIILDSTAFPCRLSAYPIGLGQRSQDAGVFIC